MADLVNSTHHCLMEGIDHRILDEGFIDLQVIDWKILEVGEIRDTGTKVIQGEVTAILLEPAEDAPRLDDIRYGRGLGNLEADLFRDNAAGAKTLQHMVKETIVGQGLAGKVGVYIERSDGSLRCRGVSAPTSAELARLTRDLARGVGRLLERQGLLDRDAENSHLAGDAFEDGPMEQLLGSSVT